MNRSYRKRSWKVIGQAVMIVVAVTAVLLAAYEYHECNVYMEKISSLEEQLSSYERIVYVAVGKLPKGTVLTEDKVQKQTRYLEYPSEEFITEKDFGMAVAQDVPEGTCLMVSMLCPREGNVREFFLAEAEIPEHVQTGDRVDLRIRYDNAEEYVVLADKRILSCEAEQGMVIKLTEEEILFVSSAIADREQYDHTKLYVVEYPEYEPVEAGRVTYIANREILTLLGREKTEGESRIALEQRLMQKKQ